jgi:hypothetical protein
MDDATRICERCLDLQRPATHPITAFLTSHRGQGMRERKHCATCRAELYPQGRRSGRPLVPMVMPEGHVPMAPSGPRPLGLCAVPGRCNFCGESPAAGLVRFVWLADRERADFWLCHDCDRGVQGFRNQPRLMILAGTILLGIGRTQEQAVRIHQTDNQQLEGGRR